MKKALVVLAALLVLTGLASASSKEFSIGKFYLTPQVGIASWGGSIPFGVSGEYALTENIGIGGSAMMQFWSDSWGSMSWIMLAVEANYHFIKLAADKLDLYVGAGLGYGLYSVSYSSGYLTGGSGGSGLILFPHVGGRYWISPKLGISLRLIGSLVGGYTGFGGELGVTLPLK